MHGNGIRQVFEQFVKPTDSPETQMGRAYEFACHFKKSLGLTENEYGRPVLKDPQMSPHSFNFRHMAESLIGYNWPDQLQVATGNAYRVFEAGGVAAIVPGSIPGVSAWLSSVTGLLEAAVLETYDQPKFIIDQLIPTKPAETTTTALLGMGRLGDAAKRREPGQPHDFAQFSERKVVTPETYNDGLAGLVTYEAVKFDQTGLVLQKMNAIGEEMGLRKELDGFRLIYGYTNPYNYNGTSFNTYQTAGTYWTNQFASNLEDWTDINLINSYFSRMTDQEHGLPIVADWDTMLVTPAMALTARMIQATTEVEVRTNSQAKVFRAPKLYEIKDIVTSQYAYQVLTATAAQGGLGLAQTAAENRIVCFNTAKNGSAFVRMENFPLQIQKGAPDSFTALNHGIILSVFADQRHSFAVQEPRYTIMTTYES